MLYKCSQEQVVYHICCVCINIFNVKKQRWITKSTHTQLHVSTRSHIKIDNAFRTAVSLHNLIFILKGHCIDVGV